MQRGKNDNDNDKDSYDNYDDTDDNDDADNDNNVKDNDYNKSTYRSDGVCRINNSFDLMAWANDHWTRYPSRHISMVGCSSRRHGNRPNLLHAS